MLLGLISDSHGDGAAIQQAAAAFRQARVDIILHLGDDYEDILFLQDEPIPVLAVPGLYCPAYRDPAIPNRRREELAGVKMLLTHSPKISPYDLPGDGDPQELAQQVDLVLYGHTHVPQVSQDRRVWWINPGHLRAYDQRGWPQTFGLLRLQPPRVKVEIITLVSRDVLIDRTLILNHSRAGRSPGAPKGHEPS